MRLGSGNITLKGDIVIFPGATLTIKPGTIIPSTTVKFDNQMEPDTYNYSAQGVGTSRYAEIFVYGNLIAEGRSDNPIQFKGTSTETSSTRWGGIHEMAGSSVTLSHTEIRNVPLPSKPTNLTAEAGNEQVTLRWDALEVGNPSITKWQYRKKERGGAWEAWQDMAHSDAETISYLVEEGLVNGTAYIFQVAAVNLTGRGARI